MKIVEFRRHSIKHGPGNTDLSPEGVELAHRIAEEELREKEFSALFESPMKRSQETLRAFAEAAGDFPNTKPELFPPHMEVSETEEGMKLWSGACNRAEHKGKDMLQGALDDEPELTNEIASKAASSFRRWLSTLPNGTHALVVGHSPFMELIPYGLFNSVLKQLQPCEGFCISEENEELRLG
jgi:broad specificity phosphatase PhoE